MSETSSPFTLDHLAAILDQENITYARAQAEPTLLANICCKRVPHALRFLVDHERGYLSIAQHDLLTLSPRVATLSRIGEACRFALFANGEGLLGGFMLYGQQATNISYCAVVPTAGALLSAEQVLTTMLEVCRAVDFAYPLLQQVLWGRFSAEEAQAVYRQRVAALDEADFSYVPIDEHVEPCDSDFGGAPLEQEEPDDAATVPQWSREDIRASAFAFEVNQGTLCHPECTTPAQRETSGALVPGVCSGAFYLPAGDTALGWPMVFDTTPLCGSCQRPVVAPSQHD